MLSFLLTLLSFFCYILVKSRSFAFFCFFMLLLDSSCLCFSSCFVSLFSCPSTHCVWVLFFCLSSSHQICPGFMILILVSFFESHWRIKPVSECVLCPERELIHSNMYHDPSMVRGNSLRNPSYIALTRSSKPCIRSLPLPPPPPPRPLPRSISCNVAIHPRSAGKCGQTKRYQEIAFWIVASYLHCSPEMSSQPRNWGI